MASLHFELVSPEKLVFSGEVDQVDLPGVEGDFGVLAGHAPYIATLKPGVLTVHKAGGPEKIIVLGGLAEVSEKGLTVLASVADTEADFDRAVLEARMKETEERIAKAEPGNDLDKLLTQLDHFKTVDRHLTGTAIH